MPLPEMSRFRGYPSRLKELTLYMKLRIGLIIGATAIFVLPWVWAFLAVAGSPKPGSKEDGPFTTATYLSFLTFPAALTMILVACLVVKVKKQP